MRQTHYKTSVTADPAMQVERDRPDFLDSPAIKHALQHALLEIDSETNATWFELIIRAWIGKACAGSYPHLRELLLRLCSEDSQSRNQARSDNLFTTQQDLRDGCPDDDEQEAQEPSRQPVVLPITAQPPPKAKRTKPGDDKHRARRAGRTQAKTPPRQE